MTKKFVIFIFSLALAIGLVSARPLVISADSLSGEFDNDSVVGVQVEENEELLSGVQGTRYTFNIILDGFYVGNFQIHVEYDSYNLTSGNWDHYNIDRTVYVCGYDTYFETWMRENWLPPSSIIWSASVNNSDQCLYVGRMESQQLLNLLIAIRNSYNTNSNVEIGYLNQIDQKIDILTRVKQYNFPIESFTFVDYLFDQGLSDVGLTNYSYYSYPVFSVSNGNSIYRTYLNTSNNNSIIFIMGLNKTANTSSVVSSYFTTNKTGTWKNYKSIGLEGANNFRIFSIEFEQTGGEGTYWFYAAEDMQLLPILAIRKDEYNNHYFSTDFALLFGLSNQLLDDIHVIAQGNQASNSSSSYLENSSYDFSTSANTMFNYEETFNDNLTDSLDDINTNFSFDTNFGSNFLNSAQFVKQQYDLLTANNAFGSLLAFSLLLGLGLLILGKIL